MVRHMSSFFFDLGSCFFRQVNMRMHSGALLERDRFSLCIAWVCHKTPCCVTAIYCSKHQLYWGCDVMIIYIYDYIRIYIYIIYMILAILRVSISTWYSLTPKPAM